MLWVETEDDVLWEDADDDTVPFHYEDQAKLVDNIYNDKISAEEMLELFQSDIEEQGND